MRYIKKIGLLGLLLGILTIVGWLGVASAQTVTNTVDKKRVVDSSLYSGGKNIAIHGMVNGDVFCAGETVVITGTVRGDVICAAQKLTIKGRVTGSVRVAAQEMYIDAAIGRSLTALASSMHIAQMATIAQDVTISGNTIVVDGKVGRDSVIEGGTTKLSGTMGRNVVYNGSELIVKEDARVRGAIRYESNQSIKIDENAAITGEITRTTNNDKRSGKWTTMLIAALLAAVLFAMITVLLWPQAVHAVSDVAVRSLGKTMLAGIVAALALPVVVVGLSLTIVGLPIALFLLCAGVLIALLSGPIAAYYLGSMILSRSKNAIAIMAVGAGVLLAVYCIPIAGPLAAMLAYFIGSGALILTIKRRMSRPDYRVE